MTRPQWRQAYRARHNGHTFHLQNEYGGQVSFRCDVCGLAAIAEKHGGQLKNWLGAGAETSCGDAIAKEVMES
jgi:hypothetical protein